MFPLSIFLLHSTRSSDGRILVVSSLDGYCSIVSFKDGELGKPSQINPTEYVSNKLKAKREAKKKAVNIDVASKLFSNIISAFSNSLSLSTCYFVLRTNVGTKRFERGFSLIRSDCLCVYVT